jgi:hypothetical protein
VTAVNDNFPKHGIKQMFAEHEKNTRGDRPRRDWYEEQCRMPYPKESDYYSDRSSDRKRRRLRDIKPTSSEDIRVHSSSNVTLKQSAIDVNKTAQIFLYRFVTAFGDITVSPENHRFIAMDNTGECSWRAFEYDGDPPLDTSMMKKKKGRIGGEGLFIPSPRGIFKLIY